MSTSLIVMKCFSYLICIFVNNWILNCQSLIFKTRRKEPPGQPLLGNGNSVNLPFYLNSSYTHISKQIYLLSKKIHGILGCCLNKSVDYDNFVAVNNLTIIFYTKLTKIWFSIIMIQAITYMAQILAKGNHSNNVAYAQRPCSRFHWKVIAWSRW